MTLKDDITAQVQKIFQDQWKTRQGRVVPDADSLVFGNEAVEFDGTVLYADLDGSTKMVDNYKKHFASEIYKSFLNAAARVIRSEGGEIVAYDGDRVMAVFIGDTKNTTAVRCALKIHWVVRHVVMPLKNKQYPNDNFTIRHVVGIDTGSLWAVKTGVRGANDLVWVGPAANYAAKLTELDSDYPTWITNRVYERMLDSARYASDGRQMWELRSWTAMNQLPIYRSSFWWTLS